MSLQVWLPLAGNLDNFGLKTVTTSGATTFSTPGKIAGAALNSSNTLSISTGLSGLKVWSFCFWGYVVSSSITTNWTGIASITDGSSNLRIEVCPKGNYLPDNPYCYSTHNNTGAAITTDSINTKGTANYDKWIHFCLTSDGTTITRYINGEKDGTCSYTGSGSFTGGINLINNNKIYKNDVRFYDHCLSAKEVKEISKALVLHYNLDSPTGVGSENANLARASTGTAMGSFPELKSTTFSGWDNYATYDLDLTAAEWAQMIGKTITYRCWIHNVEQTKGTGTGIMLHVRYTDGTYSQYGGGKNGINGSYFAQGESGWAWLTITIPNPATRTNPTTIDKVQFSIRHNSTDGAGTCEYQFAKVEKGSVATVWLPNKNDTIYSQYYPTIETDCGIANIYDGTKTGTFEYSSDTPRYSTSTKFTSTGGIKCTNFYVGNEWTYSIWFKYPSKDNSGWKPLLLLNNNGGDTDLQLGSYINCSGNNIQYSANGKYATTVTFEYNKWNHIVGTYDGTTLKCYLNGEYKTSVTPGQTLSRSNLGIGCRSSATDFSTISTSSANALLSDARIYATALSDSDITELYHTAAIVDNQNNMYTYEYVEEEVHA